MYKYEGAMTMATRAGSLFTYPDLEFQPLHVVLTSYYKVYLTLSNPASTDPIYVDLTSLKGDLGAFVGTVSEWLTQNGDKTIPSISKLPSNNIRYARYGEASRAGFTLNLANEGINYPEGLSRSVYRDVAVERDGANMLAVHNCCLFTANGFVHDSSANKDKAFVRNGAVTAQKSDTYSVGLIDFGEIGSLTRIKLQKENIGAFENNFSMREKIRFTVPEYVTNKAYFLVMGGYLIFPQENTFYQVGDKEFALDLNQLDIVERLLESSEFIDLTGLGASQPDNMDQEAWRVEELLSDAVLKNYLTLSQSFFVMLSSENLAVVRTPVMNEKAACSYLSATEPVDPLMGGHGRLMEYWPIQGHAQWVINVTDNFRRHYAASDQSLGKPKVVDHTPDLLRRNELSAGYFLEISSTVEN